jgi:hypothetical protein
MTALAGSGKPDKPAAADNEYNRLLSVMIHNSNRMSKEVIRRILIPGMAAIIAVWLVQSGIDTYIVGNAVWMPSARVPFTRVPLFLHWDMMAAFAASGVLSSLYGAFVCSSPGQRATAALFPVVWEILKWLWLLRFPLASWIDPAHPVNRFLSLPFAVSVNYWIIHIVLPAITLLATLFFFNGRLRARSAVKIENARSGPT